MLCVLVGLPPDVADVIGALGAAPLSLTNSLLTASTTSQNNWSVAKNYQLGMIQTWNSTLSKTLMRVWSFNVGYTGVKGTNLDLLRAPNRGPNGLTVPGVQAFTWETSAAHSIMNQMNLSLVRGLARGFSGGVSYALTKSMDNASSLGSGGVVAQNDQNLGAEWANSAIVRRHQLSANTMWEIPFGVGRRWLTNGGFLGQVIGDWSFSTIFSYSTGLPSTVRVVGGAGSVASGSNGSLRADYINGQPILLANPQVLASGAIQYVNPAAFAVPVAGAFGDSSRDMVWGPSTHQLNGVFNRDIRLGGTRFLSLSVNINNLLNTVNWGTVDTNINSPTFGQITSVRGMRTMTITGRFRF